MAVDPVSAGLAAFSVGSSLLGGMAADKAAEKMVDAELKLLESRSAEEARQMRAEHAMEMGAARAAIGASNIQFEGSSARYLRAMDYNNMREQAYQREYTDRQRNAIQAGGQGAGTPFYTQAAGDLIGYAAKAFIQSRGTPAASVSGSSSPPDPWDAIYKSEGHTNG